VKLAKQSMRKNPIVLSEEEIVNTTWKTPVKVPFSDISHEDKQFYFKNIDKSLKKNGGKQLKSRIAVYMLYSDKKLILNSEGSKIYSENSLPAVYMVNTAKAKNGTEQRMLGVGGNGGWEWFKNHNFEDIVLEENINLIKVANRAKNMEFSKPIDVIVSGEVAGIMSHENVGHPSEGDRIIGREGAQAGESFYADLLKEKKLGEIKLGNDCVNIIDDPSHPEGAGFYLYDDECVKTRPRYLIKEGRLNELLLNREYAARFGLKSNGAARALAYNREPLSRMANTYFAPGDFGSLEELCEDIKYGILMNNFTEWNIDDRRFQSKYVGQEAYLIKDGKLTDTLVKRPILELTTIGILSNVDAITKKPLQFSYGSCGKSDPMQGIPVSMGGAKVRIRNIHVGGGK
jgi:TldD protein